MTKRDERIKRLAQEHGGKDDEESLIDEDVMWLITELEKEIERGRKLREALLENDFDKHAVNCTKMLAQNPQHFKCSCNYVWIKKAIAEYDQESEK